MGKSCLLLRFSDDSFTTSFITTIGCLAAQKVTFQYFPELTSRSRLSTLMESVLSCRSGILQARSAFAPSQPPIIVEQWESFLYMTSQTNSPSTVRILHAFYRHICTDIRNWIRNIEQHAADHVEKVLIGNKCDMVADKVPTQLLAAHIRAPTRAGCGGGQGQSPGR